MRSLEVILAEASIKYISTCKKLSIKVVRIFSVYRNQSNN